MPYVGRADFSYRVIVWDAQGVRITQEPAGVDDLEMALACYEIAIKANPGEPVTLQQGAMVIRKNRDYV